MRGFLLDTNCVSEGAKVRPDKQVESWAQQTPDDFLYISVLTLGEIRKGIVSLVAGRRRIDLEQWLENTLRPSFGSRVLPVTEAIAIRWGVLVGEARRSGRTLPAIDSLLAATALEHNLTLVTRNTRDFEGTSVQVISPWKL